MYGDAVDAKIAPPTPATTIDPPRAVPPAPQSHPKDLLNAVKDRNVDDYIARQFSNSQAQPTLSKRRKSITGNDSGALVGAGSTRRSVVLRSEGVLPPSMPEISDAAATELESLLATVDDDDAFDVWALDRLTNGNGLAMLTWHLLTKSWKSCELLNVDAKRLDAWLFQLQQHYVDTPYHNHVHATDVLHLTHVYLRKGLYKRMDDIEIFALIMAAAAHDVGHDGLNNDYHSAVLTDLARVYNNISPQENGHAHRVFEIMQSADANVLHALPRETAKRIRALVISNILGTDMVGHKAMLSELKDYLDRSDEGRDESVPLPSVGFLGKVILHLADINNPARTWELAEFWANRCLIEFFHQGDLEKELSLPVSPLCDRLTVNIPNSQVGFIDFVVMPAFQEFARLLPYASKCVDRLKENRELWSQQPDERHKAKIVGYKGLPFKPATPPSASHGNGALARPEEVALEQVASA